MNSSLEKSRRIRTAGIYAFFVVGSIIMIFPFVWMFLTSFKSAGESVQIPRPSFRSNGWRTIIPKH